VRCGTGRTGWARTARPWRYQDPQGYKINDHGGQVDVVDAHKDRGVQQIFKEMENDEKVEEAEVCNDCGELLDDCNCDSRCAYCDHLPDECNCEDDRCADCGELETECICE